MQPSPHGSGGRHGATADALPLLHAAAAAAAATTTATSAPPAPPLALAAASSYRGYKAGPRAASAKPGVGALHSTTRPAPDWARPLAALERQKESARLAYTPFTVAAADVVAARRAEFVSRYGTPLLRLDDRDGTTSGRSDGWTRQPQQPPLQVLPPLPTECEAEPHAARVASGEGMQQAENTAPAAVAAVREPLNHSAVLSDISRSSPPSSSPSFNATALPEAAARRHAAAAAGRAQLAPLRPCASAATLSTQRTSSARGTSRRVSQSASHRYQHNNASSPILHEGVPVEGNEDIIAQHYRQLNHLLQGYHSDDRAADASREGGIGSWMFESGSGDGGRQHRGSSASARLRSNAGAAPTRISPVAQPALTLTPSTSSAASAGAVSTDLFRQAAAQQRRFTPRTTNATKAEVSRFQRHLQRYFDRQFSGLLHYEEVERAQLRTDAFRALSTLLSMHERFCTYVELRARQAAALAVLQAEEAELKAVFNQATACDVLPVAADAARRTGDDSLDGKDALSGSEAEAESEHDDGDVYTELVEGVGTAIKARGLLGVFEELTMGRADVRALTADLLEKFELLAPPLFFDVLDSSATTHTRVPPAPEPFEELWLVEADAEEAVAALQEPFELLVPTAKERGTPIAEDGGASVEEAADAHEEPDAVEEEELFEELVAPPDTPEAAVCTDVLNHAPFDVLVVSDATRAEVAAWPLLFEELYDADASRTATAAAVAAMQEVFEALSLLRCFDELAVDPDVELAMPPPLVDVEELAEDAATEEAVSRLQEVYEELLLPPPTPEPSEPDAADSAGDAYAVPMADPFEDLEVSVGTAAKVPSPSEPFEELQASLSIKAEVAAMHEGFEELLLTHPFETLVEDSTTADAVLPPLEPFEELVETDTAGDRYAEVDAGLRREIFEELHVPAEAAVEEPEELPAVTEEVHSPEPLPDVFVELVVRAGTHTKISDPAEPFEELLRDEDTEDDVAELLEAFEGLVVPPLPSPRATASEEALGSDVDGLLLEGNEEETEGSEFSLTAYRVGAPMVCTDEKGSVRHVTCAFTDLTLDAFASTALGDVFAEACGVRRPVIFACRQHVEGVEWCAHLLTAGAAVRECVVADVCAVLECPAVRVRNVTLVATAGEAEAASSSEASHAAVGLSVSFDLVHETVFALYPHDDVQYLISECTFPFLHQWRRSHAALLMMESLVQTPTAAAASVQPSASEGGAAAAHARGAAIPLWAYTTEPARLVRKSTAKLPSARLSFSPGFRSDASSLLITGVADADGVDSVLVVATPHAVPTPPPTDERVINILAGAHTGLVSPASVVTDKTSGSEEKEDAAETPRPPAKRKGFFSRK